MFFTRKEEASRNQCGWEPVTTPVRVVGVAALATAIYHILAFSYVCFAMGRAAMGPSGSTLVVTDDVALRFPKQFALIQRLPTLPIPNDAARQYYERELPAFLEAARNFDLHPYWHTYNEATPYMTYREVVTERIRAMYKQLLESGRMDYRIEKDRCAQFDFFILNGIPHPEIKKKWYSREEMLEDVTSGDGVMEMIDQWPVFFKACHLTQRSSLGTFPISSKQQYAVKQKDLVRWIDDKWEYRSRDVDRPWQTEGDALTDQLVPSFVLQEPMVERNGSAAAFHMDGRVSVGLVEIKAEVIWGRVYIMLMDAVTIFRRDGEIEDYSNFYGAILHRPGKSNPRVEWIREGGYLDCVVELAERVGKAAHIDYVRVDIFLDRSDPNGCVVNEISLSSGYTYYGHEQYMAALWAGPLRSKIYKTFDSNTPVYELSSSSS